MARPAPQPRSSPLDTGLRLALRYPLPAPKLRRRFPQPGEGTTQVPGVRGGMAARGPLRWGGKCPPSSGRFSARPASHLLSCLWALQAPAALRPSLFAGPRTTVLPGPVSTWLQFEVTQMPNRQNSAQSLLICGRNKVVRIKSWNNVWLFEAIR